MISLILADDHPATRAGLKSILSSVPDIKIVAEAENGQEIPALVQEFHPDILLLDLIMPNLKPAEIEKWVRINFPETQTLVLTAHDRDAYLAEMVDAGISGFLTKNDSAENLINCIHRAANGEVLITSDQRVRIQEWKSTVENKWKSLTKKEKEISGFLVLGLDNTTIANRLCVTKKTVEYHISNILGKLELRSRQEVISWCFCHGKPDGLNNTEKVDIE
jgi:DNA-binding NarL/FixJ family response regulator